MHGKQMIKTIRNTHYNYTLEIHSKWENIHLKTKYICNSMLKLLLILYGYFEHKLQKRDR